MNKVLILGGAGFVGRHVCTKLALLPWQVTVPTRRFDRTKSLQIQSRLDLFEADIFDEATLARLLQGQDAVINLVAQLHGDEAALARAHVELPQKLARACSAAGVHRVIHVSALGVPSLQPELAPSRYLRSKARGEAVLRQAVAAYGLDLTVLRPSVIFGEDDRFLNVFAALQRRFPFIPLAGGGSWFQPVWVEDVAQALVNALADPRYDRESIGQTYEACGPERFTLQDLVNFAGHAAGVNHGRGRPVIDLPPALGRLQARLLECAPGEPMMTRDNLDSMQVPNIASGVLPGLQALGVTPSGLSAIAPRYLAPMDPATRLRHGRTGRRGPGHPTHQP
ncbi:NAD-dependent dehydratase [Rhodoferax koreense]|uniref:NAD-dependent dehydratase n=1 Tax=Rhodoferax koreensis TaxID=1842727 RepID=A0A1P8JSZ2_9BURK|nr:complex I NDUFA9 subunit family protein [Rhodoferax koreense]APW36882.1 NAD-dependent dehydratase [Rhodoferax koreense]